MKPQEIKIFGRSGGGIDKCQKEEFVIHVNERLKEANWIIIMSFALIVDIICVIMLENALHL